MIYKKSPAKSTKGGKRKKTYKKEENKSKQHYKCDRYIEEEKGKLFKSEDQERFI